MEKPFAEQVRPITSKFIIASKMGCKLTLDPQGALDTAQTIEKLAKALDAAQAAIAAAKSARLVIVEQVILGLFLLVLAVATLIFN